VAEAKRLALRAEWAVHPHSAPTYLRSVAVEANAEPSPATLSALVAVAAALAARAFRAQARLNQLVAFPAP